MSDKEGTVQITNGQVIAKDPQGKGRKATIKAGEGIKLFVDGLQITEKIEVTEKSKIAIEVLSMDAQKYLIINISEDKFKATAKVMYTDGIIYTLNDTGPKRELVINAHKGDIVKHSKFTLDEALEIVKNKDITYGIIEENLLKVINEEEIKEIVIAQGVLPKNAKDDYIKAEYKVSSLDIDEDEKVDFKNRFKIPSVNIGEIIARKIPGDEGLAGINIYGQRIEQKKGKKISLKALNGVEISKDGLEAYAAIQGKPEIKGDIISVYPVYEHNSNVDIKSGNISFQGDIAIRGDINEGMKVEASNKVFLYGSINDSKIVAGSDILVLKNVISSEINAGNNDFIKRSIIDILNIISKELNNLYKSIDVLKDTGKLKQGLSDGRIIKLLIDTKFRSLIDQIEKLREKILYAKDYVEKDIVKVCALIIKYFTMNGPLLFKDFNELKEFDFNINSTIDKLTEELKNPCDINAGYIQNSLLTTSGNIIITGKGCYNSNLICRGNVEFKRPGSVVRGGKIEAQGDIKLQEVGSNAGTMTEIITEGDYSIICTTAYVNTLFKIGDLSIKLDNSYRNVKVYLYKGEIMCEKQNI